MTPEERNGQAVREELERVLASPGFARNERLCRFLRFVFERHLAGRDQEIKESLIAVEVFGRKPDYDPKQYSIVRTEAGRLRARLAEYYAGEGNRDPVVIELPKGGYTPVFREAEERAPADHKKRRAAHNSWPHWLDWRWPWQPWVGGGFSTGIGRYRSRFCPFLI